ncbi:lipid asymmetry maintenance protein MlaB [Serratia microhaemolytica]|uniref:lipid asymmetry maintenance protein MlaB n=1 Tax=Serratia microhaemolytica TaxID=2675110 RepID=UPI000FDE9BEF|nr:lipid asymmetry maintenance protein MlaB [Serratia microhaemolytica]
MNTKLSWFSQQQTLFLQGELDRETLRPLWQQRQTLLAGKTILDLSQLQRVDSSGLALLFHFLQQQGATLKITGISEQLGTLITLYNLSEFIDAAT